MEGFDVAAWQLGGLVLHQTAGAAGWRSKAAVVHQGGGAASGGIGAGAAEEVGLAGSWHGRPGIVRQPSSCGQSWLDSCETAPPPPSSQKAKPVPLPAVSLHIINSSIPTVSCHISKLYRRLS